MSPNLPESIFDISIVIGCNGDNRIFDCIKSIDYPAEVVVALTKNKTIENKLQKMGIRYCIVPKGNCGLTRNRGIELSTTSKVILMDADSTFGKGTIKKLFSTLNKYDACKPRLIYLQKPDNKISRVISEARDYINSIPTLAYTPGLAFNINIKKSIGNYFFREDVFWAEDSELSYRINLSHLKFNYVKGVSVFHPYIPLKHDLKGAYLIGVGKRRAVEAGARHGDENILPTLLRLLGGKSLSLKFDILKKKGVTVMAYMFLWDIFYYFGYYSKRLKCSRKIESSIWRTFGQR